jgi:hypothetical protein
MVASYHHDERIDDTELRKRQWPSEKDLLGRSPTDKVTQGAIPRVEAERQACEIRLRAERRAGALAPEIEHSNPGSRKTDLACAVPPKSSVLRNAVTVDQARQWEKLAAVPQETFDAALRIGPKCRPRAASFAPLKSRKVTPVGPPISPQKRCSVYYQRGGQAGRHGIDISRFGEVPDDDAKRLAVLAGDRLHRFAPSAIEQEARRSYARGRGDGFLGDDPREHLHAQLGVSSRQRSQIGWNSLSGHEFTG